MPVSCLPERRVALEIVSTDPSLNSEDVVKEFRKIGSVSMDFGSSFVEFPRAFPRISTSARFIAYFLKDGENDSNFLFTVLF